MSKRRDEIEPKSSADWMTTYSDMMTLLFAFFVLLFALSNVDQAKAALFFAGVSGGITDQEFIMIQSMYGITGVGNEEDGWDFSGPEPEEPVPPEDGDDGTQGENPLDALYNEIIIWISDNDLAGSIGVLYNGESLLLTLANDMWFASGRADITTRMVEQAEILARLLQATWNPDDPFDIVVAGHTDNVPINTAQFPSNWYLSAMRALNFQRILIDESGIAYRYFRIHGYGEEMPIATNETSEGRQENRRVELMISRLNEHPEREFVPTPGYNPEEP
jgi:chemotaxis protein MotB